MQRRDKVRQTYFNAEEIKAFWSDEDQADAYLAKRLRILNEAGLTDSDRQLALQQAEAQSFSAEEVAHRRESQQPLQAQRQTQQFNANDTTDADRFAQRAQAYGAPAAQRLAAMDHQEENWQQRLDRYEAAGEADKQALAQDLFTATERRRLEGAISFRKSQRLTPK